MNVQFDLNLLNVNYNFVLVGFSFYYIIAVVDVAVGGGGPSLPPPPHRIVSFLLLSPNYY